MKRKKLEGDVRRLQRTTKEQSKTIARIKTGCLENSRGSSSKSWTDYSRQQQHNKKKTLAEKIHGALSFCEGEGFQPCTVDLENVDTGLRCFGHQQPYV